MNSTISKYDSVENLVYKNSDGHYHLHVPALHDFDSHSNDDIDFIFDTGAFLTVLTQDTVTRLGYAERFTVQCDIQLSGFVGGCLADLKEIPGFIIGGRRLEGVKVAVPHIETDANILGLNVIENFKYFIDTENDKIYFAENPKSEIPELLRVKKIYVVSSSQI
ncbi:MAG: aspartyl protease family protein [Defluviitaleaceae bacterium]|nr:aspartyl protease family protein [Defluviitaleaceae bacterium]